MGLVQHIVIGSALLIVVTPAIAETMRSALLRAYASNPDLTAARARLRAVDENVGIAAAAGRPQAGGAAVVTQNIADLGRFRNAGRDASVNANLSYNLYAGGRVSNSVRGAKVRVVASRADLRAVEGDVFASVVTAYLDVIRDAYVVSLNTNQVAVLDQNFTAAKVRFQAGDLTRTDVAQSEARLADARSQLVAAQGMLTASSETYRRIVGVWPVDLQTPPDLPHLPADPDEAATVALANAPTLRSSGAAVDAAHYDIAVAKAQRLPVVAASVGAGYTNYLGTANTSLGVSDRFIIPQGYSSGVASVTATIPLYQGGGPAARVRQAQALASEAGEQNVGVERTVIATARSAFAGYQVAVATIRSSEAAVSANALALRGTQEEQQVGARLLLDVLNAQQELLNSQVALVSARHDQYVAGFALLNAMGRGDLESLDLSGVALYDPIPHYERAARSISDWADDRERPPAATRTTDPTPVDMLPTRIEPIRISGEVVTQSATITRAPIDGGPAPAPVPITEQPPSAPPVPMTQPPAALPSR